MCRRFPKLIELLSLIIDEKALHQDQKKSACQAEEITEIARGKLVFISLKLA